MPGWSSHESPTVPLQEHLQPIELEIFVWLPENQSTKFGDTSRLRLGGLDICKDGEYDFGIVK